MRVKPGPHLAVRFKFVCLPPESTPELSVNSGLAFAYALVGAGYSALARTAICGQTRGAKRTQQSVLLNRAGQREHVTRRATQTRSRLKRL